MSHPIIEINPNLKAKPIDVSSLTYADNPRPRCPVVLLLDCSGSMEGEPIRELNQALRRFHAELMEDPVAKSSVELCVITFGESVKIRQRFGPLDQPYAISEIPADGSTPLGEALTQALGEIRGRRSFYRQHGLSAYRPWIVIMTDGQPNDEWRQPAAETLSMVRAGHLVMLGVGIGPHADLSTLRAIVGSDPGPFRLEGLKFRNFFRWLSDSLRATVQTPPSHPVVNLSADDDWNI